LVRESRALPGDSLPRREVPGWAVEERRGGWGCHTPTSVPLPNAWMAFPEQVSINPSISRPLVVTHVKTIRVAALESKVTKCFTRQSKNKISTIYKYILYIFIYIVHCIVHKILKWTGCRIWSIS